jgi:4-hydroxy-tetrahydrodipicolinate reductase
MTATSGTPSLALIGMGKMGQTLDELADERGMQVAARIGRGDSIDTASLSGADVALEFTEPGSALANVRACMHAGIPVVVGTTGWHDALPAVAREAAAAGARLLWAPNFSLGVNAMIKLAADAGRLLRDSGFGVHLVETHHAEKKDAPSGTAIAVARSAESTLGRAVPITSLRVGFVPGEHTLVFDGPFEQLRLTHDARDRRVFAEGALVAARWLAAQRAPGVYTMSDVLEDRAS